MAQNEIKPGIGGLELTPELRATFESFLEQGRTKISSGPTGEPEILVTWGKGVLFYPLNLTTGKVENDELGPEPMARPQFLMWAREKAGWQPPQE